MTILVYSAVAILNVMGYISIAERYKTHNPFELQEWDTFWVIFNILSFAASITNIIIELWKI